MTDVAERNRARRYSYRVDWDNESRLGAWSDADLARELHVSPAAVYAARLSRKIPAPKRNSQRQGGSLDRAAKALRAEIQHLRKIVLDQGDEIKEMRRLFSRCDECGAEPGHLCADDSDAPAATHAGRGA